MNIIKKNYIVLALVLSLLLSGSDSAAGTNQNAGTSAFSFLKINISARSVAMGGAFTGLADDEAALYYNPAGLASIEKKRFIFGYHNYIADMQSGFIGYIKPLGKERSLGFYLNYLNYGDFTQTDETGTVLGEFGGSDILLAVSFAMRHNYSFSFGGSAKFIYEKIDQYAASGLAFDLGVKYDSDRRRFGAGLMIQNLGFQLSSLGEEKDKLPLAVRTGLFYKPKGLPVTFTTDLIFPNDNDLYFALGAEYMNLKPFYMRLGWNSFGSNYRTSISDDNWSGYSLGVGFDFKKMMISYAFSPAAELGDSHRITLTRGW